MKKTILAIAVLALAALLPACKKDKGPDLHGSFRAATVDYETPYAVFTYDGSGPLQGVLLFSNTDPDANNGSAPLQQVSISLRMNADSTLPDGPLTLAPNSFNDSGPYFNTGVVTYTPSGIPALTCIEPISGTVYIRHERPNYDISYELDFDGGFKVFGAYIGTIRGSK